MREGGEAGRGVSGEWDVMPDKRFCVVGNNPMGQKLGLCKCPPYFGRRRGKVIVDDDGATLRCLQGLAHSLISFRLSSRRRIADRQKRSCRAIQPTNGASARVSARDSVERPIFRSARRPAVLRTAMRCETAGW